MKKIILFTILFSNLSFAIAIDDVNSFDFGKNSSSQCYFIEAGQMYLYSSKEQKVAKVKQKDEYQVQSRCDLCGQIEFITIDDISGF